jgi:hypothetical protein
MFLPRHICRASVEWLARRIRDPASKVRLPTMALIRQLQLNILGPDVYSHVLRPAGSFIPPGSINLVPASAGRLTFSVRRQGQRVGRLAAAVGATGLTCRMRCPSVVVLTFSLPTCESHVLFPLSASLYKGTIFEI